MDTSAFREELHRLRTHRGLSYRQLAALSTVSPSLINDLEKDGRRPTLPVTAALDAALEAHGRLLATLRTPAPDDIEGELEALELAQRAAESDVSETALSRLEKATDAMAMGYATTAPAELLPKVRRYLRYIDQLFSTDERRCSSTGGFSWPAAG